jgi:hypothetical protein
MMRIYLICFAVFLAQGLAAQESPLISLPATSFDISAAREQDTIAIPIIPNRGIAPGDIQLAGPSAVWVRFGQRYDQSFLDGIKLSKSADGTKLWAVVDLGILKAAGAYEVRIALEAKGHPPGKDQRQEFNLTFNRPTAKLEAVQTISIHVVGDAVESSDPFQLKGTGNQTSLFHLSLPPPLFPGVKGSALIRFPDTTYTVTAGQDFQADYVIDAGRIADLPLGPTKGTMDINSPALSAPVTVNFEITHTRPKYWIFICLLAGLAAGNFVRLFLSSKRDLEDKREDGYTLLVQIERETTGITDPVFCQTVMNLSTTLKTLLDADGSVFVAGAPKLNALKALITQTNTDYNTAKKTLDDLLKDLQEKTRAISPLFVNNNLSPYLTASLAAAAGYYQQAVVKLGASDGQDAGLLMTATLTSIRTFAGAYCAADGNVHVLIAGFKDGTGYPSAIDSATKDVIRENSTRLEEELTAIQPAGDEAPKLTALIQSIDSVQANLQKLLNFVMEKVSEAFAIVYADPTDPAMIGFKKAFDQWKAAMAMVLTDPLQIFDKGAAVALSNAWPVKKPDAVGRGGAGFVVRAEAPAEDAGEAFLWPWIKASRYLSAGLPVAVRSLIPTPEAGERQAGNNYLLYSIIQTFFLLVVMSLAAYKYYAPSFVGTLDGMLGIFLVAFGTDITVDKVNVWKGS